MKQIAFYNYYKMLNKNNNMFMNAGSATIKDFLHEMHVLKEYANSKDIIVGSVDVLELEKVDAFVFIDMPNIKNKYIQYAMKSKKPMYLIVWESPIVNLDNYLPENLKLFQKVFTYDDSMVDNINSFKLPYTFEFPVKILRNFSDRKLCTIIAGNKFSEHPLELYSYRRKVIRWFESNHISDFDLYGKDWNRYIFRGSFIKRVLNQIDFLKKLVAPKYISFKGEVQSKTETFQKYKFSICFENVKNIPGYITEKIFDSFFGGCVPVYLGADNIDKFIPQNCFIDERDFNSIGEIYNYISNITEDQYNEYINNIEKFLNSEKAYIFKPEYFARLIIDNISL